MASKGNKASAAVHVIRDMRQVDIREGGETGGADNAASSSPSRLRMQQGGHDAAAALAEKYHVDLDISGDSLRGADGSLDEARVMESILQNQDLVARSEALVRRLDDKNREVDRLCTLLEGVAMVPGVDPDKLLNIYDGVAEEPIDLRDSKIVYLAKKVRTLTMNLNKERGLRASASSRIEELQQLAERQQRDLDLLASPAARAAALGSASSRAADAKNGDSPGRDLPPQDTRRELAQAKKQLEEMRHKLHQSAEECKRLQRALQKEVGDGASMEQVLDDGWKGRAQLIVMLKNKVRKLEQSLQAATGADAMAAGGGDGNASLFPASYAGSAIGGPAFTVASSARYSQAGGASVYSGSRARDVDSKAEFDLAEMSSERQRAVEQLTADYANLSDECEKLKQKCERQKVRMRTLENEAAKHKENLKMMVDKADSDDQLIEALREEAARLRDALQKVAMKQREEAQMKANRDVRAPGVSSLLTHAGSSSADRNSGVQSALESEMIRLNRLVKQQADQIETQEALLRRFRAADAANKYT